MKWAVNLFYVVIYGSVLVFLLSYVVANDQKDGEYKKCILQLAERKVVVEIADTPKLRQKGLMFRKCLPENNAMLFIFPKEERLSFWMKNTLIPLDIGFFNSERCLVEVCSMEVLSLKTVYSSFPAKYALETNKGWFLKHKIALGTCFNVLDISE